MLRKSFRTFFALACCVLALSLINLFNASAQSGRGRTPAPPPKPTEKPGVLPTTVLNVPEGGKLLRQDLDGVTSRYALKNGLTVLIRERHAAPLVSLNVGVKVGSLNETDEQAGMARLVQRMILKGTPTRPVGAVEKEAARLGGVLEADSSYDLTNFRITAPTESLPGLLELLVDLLQHPSFDAEELKKTAAQMLQESRSNEDRAAFALARMYATAFSVHRLKRGNTVSEAMLNSVTREQVQSFFQTYYQPQHIIVTIVGDTFSLKAVGEVQLTFGNLVKAAPAPTPAPVKPKTTVAAKPTPTPTPTPTPAPSTLEELPQDKLRYGNTRADISQTIVTIGYRVPTLTKESLQQQATLEVLAAALGLGRGSRLAQMLPERTGLPTESVAYYFAFPGVGMFSVQLRVEPGRIDRAEADYFRELEKFKRELLSDGELQRARALLEKRYYDTTLRVETEAAALTDYQAQLNDFRPFSSYVARIRAVTAQDVQQAAAKYLTLANSTVHEYEPINAGPRTFTPEKFAELILTFAATAAQPVNPADVKPATALKVFKQGEERGAVTEGRNILVAENALPVKDFSVLRGPRAYVREDKSQPVISIGVFFQGGRLIEDKATSGTTELMLRAMLRSTTSRKGDLIALELESYGGEINVVNEPDFFGYTLDVLSRNAEPAVKLLLDITENPFFDKPELARERDALLAEQIKRRDDEFARSIELLLASIYPQPHPYGLPRYGVAEVVKAVTEEKLEAWHNKTVKRQLPLVIVVGDTDGSALISRIFSEGFKRSELDKTMKVNLPPLTAPPEEQVEQRSRRATAQAIGFRAPAGESADYLPLRMLGHLAATGRFADELRAKHNIGDKVIVRPDPRLASGAFFTFIATAPENEQHALEVLRAELVKLGQTPPSDEEFERGRNATIGAYAIGLQAHPLRVMEYARAVVFNRKPSDVEAQPDLIRSVKKSDLRRVAEAVVKINQIGRGVVRGQ